MRNIVVTLSFIILMPFPSTAAVVGDPRCAVENISNMPKITESRDGMPLSQPIRFIFRGAGYDIPYGYVGGNSSKLLMKQLSADGAIHAKYGLAFAFWIPSLRYVEGKRALPWLQPCEPGRPKPTSGEFVVRVRVHPPEALTEDFLTPYQKFLNHTRTSEGSFDFSNEFGLIKYKVTNAKAPAIFYTHQKNAPVELNLSCLAVSSPAINPGCHGVVYDKARSLSYWVQFYRHGIGDWQKIIDGVTQLLDRWRDPHKYPKRLE